MNLIETKLWNELAGLSNESLVVWEDHAERKIKQLSGLDLPNNTQQWINVEKAMWKTTITVINKILDARSV